MKQQKALTLKTLTKSNVWEVEENDIFRMWETAEKSRISKTTAIIILTLYVVPLK